MQRASPEVARESSTKIITVTKEEAPKQKPHDEVSPNTALSYIFTIRNSSLLFFSSAGATQQISEEASVYGMTATESICAGLVLVVLLAKLADRITVPADRGPHSAVDSATYFSLMFFAVMLEVAGVACMQMGLHQRVAGHAGDQPASSGWRGDNLNPYSVASLALLMGSSGLYQRLNIKKSRHSRSSGTAIESWADGLEGGQESSSRILQQGSGI